ncbi:hypothetical protein cce_2286 [Crocosphaera subtropica ATCC 51142]|uniref:Uncharacterized protein n=1 Tax=Crocosphaera subtropica (strain ATCC 51142 / BH68) TaxID=43989 RepID=B1WPR6_CROS5|nr:hypothetical protein cce_2286 [Crocosphaera subtropica ATCC 51142]
MAMADYEATETVTDQLYQFSKVTRDLINILFALPPLLTSTNNLYC